MLTNGGIGAQHDTEFLIIIERKIKKLRCCRVIDDVLNLILETNNVQLMCPECLGNRRVH